jgi:hypothetical protein
MQIKWINFARLDISILILIDKHLMRVLPGKDYADNLKINLASMPQKNKTWR